MDRMRSNLCDNGIAVLSASSLNRVNNATNASSHEPHLGMFRESSEIEYGVEDANFIQELDERHQKFVHLKSRYSGLRDFTTEFVGWRAEFIVVDIPGTVGSSWSPT